MHGEFCGPSASRLPYGRPLQLQRLELAAASAQQRGISRRLTRGAQGSERFEALLVWTKRRRLHAAAQQWAPGEVSAQTLREDAGRGTGPPTAAATAPLPPVNPLWLVRARGRSHVPGAAQAESPLTPPAVASQCDRAHHVPAVGQQPQQPVVATR